MWEYGQDLGVVLASLAVFIPGAEDSTGGGGEGSRGRRSCLHFQAFEMRKRAWGMAQ